MLYTALFNIWEVTASDINSRKHFFVANVITNKGTLIIQTDSL